jgi:hypothetical protein
MRRAEIEMLLEATHDGDARRRARAIRELCPCEVRADLDPVRERVLELAHDPAADVRRAVLHALCDGSPRALEPRVTAVLEELHADPDPRLRRQARRIMAVYRRTGDLDVA